MWDYETGDFERTLKGHTDSVQDFSFDHSATTDTGNSYVLTYQNDIITIQVTCLEKTLEVPETASEENAEGNTENADSNASDGTAENADENVSDGNTENTN